MAPELNFAEDADKIEFVKRPLLGAGRFVFPSLLDDELNGALDWIADRDPKQVRARMLALIWIRSWFC